MGLVLIGISFFFKDPELHYIIRGLGISIIGGALIAWAIGHLISKVGVDAIITTDIGPRAFEIFKQHEIKIYRAEGLLEDAIKQLGLGKLSEIK